MTSLARVPCTVVTGFLGAGKTTLIRHLLENAKGKRLALIVNEFGDVGVDGEILRSCGVESCPEENIVELAKKARANTLALSDLQGGSFTITNGGVFGSLLSTPILNTPQVGILGMHKIQLRPVAIDETTMENRPMMYIALSYDHRIVDGSEAVRFLVAIKEMLEDPEQLLLQG